MEIMKEFKVIPKWGIALSVIFLRKNPISYEIDSKIFKLLLFFAVLRKM